MDKAFADEMISKYQKKFFGFALNKCSSFNEAEELVNFPNIGHRIPEFPDAPYLEILVRKNFRLIYRISRDVCYIVTVRRCSMLLDETTIDELNSVE